MDHKLIIGLMVIIALFGGWYLYANWDVLSVSWRLDKLNVQEEIGGDLSGVSNETETPAGAGMDTNNVVPKPTIPASVSDQVAMKLVGKWRNEASQNQIFTIGEDRSLQESYLTADGQFMVPMGTWYIEKAIGASPTFEPANPAGALVFVRVSEKGVERRFAIQSITDLTVELTETETESGGGKLNLIRIIKDTAE